MPDLALNTKAIEEGLMPAERIVRIEDADGEIEEIAVSARNLNGNQLIASEIGRDNKNRVLVELPRESTSGRWRIWVKASEVGA